FQALEDLDGSFAIRRRRTQLVGIDRRLVIRALDRLAVAVTRSRMINGLLGIGLVVFSHVGLSLNNAFTRDVHTRMGGGFVQDGLCAVNGHQMRIGITTYLNVVLSGIVNNAELLPSDNSSLTISW